MASPTGISKITRSYQISIPPEVREELNLNKGDYVAFVKDEDSKRFYLKKVVL